MLFSENVGGVQLQDSLANEFHEDPVYSAPMVFEAAKEAVDASSPTRDAVPESSAVSTHVGVMYTKLYRLDYR